MSRTCMSKNGARHRKRQNLSVYIHQYFEKNSQ